MKLTGLILCLLGILSLAYGGFSYVRDRQDVDLGVAKFEIEQRERVDIPVWLGVGLGLGGLALVAVSRRPNRGGS